MQAQGRYQSLLGCIFVSLLALFSVGCGNDKSTSSGNPSPNGTAVSTIFVQADAGNIVAVRVGQTASLDGSRSVTSSTEPLTFAWSFTHKPYASKTALQNTTSVNPAFIADVPGTYMVQLVVSADGISSQRAIATVEVSVDGNLTGKRVHTSYPSQCANCHDGRFVDEKPPFDSVVAKSGNHLATSNMCQACHTTFGFELARFTDHIEVFGKCSACHDGVSAIGKSELHIETSAECSDCHTPTSFLPLGPDGRFDHTDVTGGCDRCHNGSIAIGKDLVISHPDTTSDCIFCHNTSNFKDAYVDHSTISASTDCASCHNGTKAKGQPTGHPEMLVDCRVCHSVKRFSLGGVFNHRVDPKVQPCSVCHNDDNSINARGKLSAPTTHVSTTADCGMCHTVVSFKPAYVDHTSSEVKTKTCVSCHDGGIALGQSDMHMPTSLDCGACHTPGTFATGVYDHDGVTNDCSSCHNNMISAGKPFDHMPTTPDNQDCADCHLIKFDDFTGVTFDHTGIDVNNCAECHNGSISAGKIKDHMPTILDCSVCHIKADRFKDFTGGVFDHLVQDVSNNCASCHNGVIAKGKKVNHIPAQVECSQCHTATGTNGFKLSIFASEVHSSLASGCEGCHTSKYFPSRPYIKAAGHLPTIQDCYLCHTNVKFTPQIFEHTGITGNCASCHSGSYVDPAGAVGKTPDHPATTADCGLCHGVGHSFKDGIFDHTGIVDNCSSCHGDAAPAPPVGAVIRKSSKTDPAHVTTSQDCSVCHVPGSFKDAVFNHTGIVDNCASCHAGTGAVGKLKSSNHLPTVEDCSVCHNTEAFAGAKFDHTGIKVCAGCHDGTITKGKLTDHVPTGDDCSMCHQTTGFKPATFSHAGIVDNCISCHDGVFAKGKAAKPDHVLTSQDCGVCHNTTAFKPATFDHSTVSSATRCDSCHGVTATGKDAKTNPPHLATSLDCRSCHTTATFVGGTWAHDAGTKGNCLSCHTSSGGATPQPSTGHFVTSEQCDRCHVITGWSPTSTFDHCFGKTKTKTGTCAGSVYPGNHNKLLACTKCHADNSQVATYSTPFDKVTPTPNQLKPDCAGCHRDDFRKEGDHLGGSSGTVYQNRNCAGSGCHKVTSSGF